MEGLREEVGVDVYDAGERVIVGVKLCVGLLDGEKEMLGEADDVDVGVLEGDGDGFTKL